MSGTLQGIIEPGSPSGRERAKFISRMFGIFSEEIISIWCQHERCVYNNLGRPRVRTDATSQPYTLDFTLQNRKSGKIFISEMKCEIEYNNFKYFVLQDASQLEHHRKPAFDVFLRSAKPDGELIATVNKQEVKVDGAILVWGAVTPKGRHDVIQSKGLHDVISVEDVCAELAEWRCPKYTEFVERRRAWCNRLFDGLLGVNSDDSERNAQAVEMPTASQATADQSALKSSAKERRTDEQERALKEIAYTLGWPADSRERAASGISNTSARLGECHYAWVVLETFAKERGREPSQNERRDLAVQYGLNFGNLNVEYYTWRRKRKTD